MLEGPARLVLDDQELDDCATRTAEALKRFLEQEKICDVGGEDDEEAEEGGGKTRKEEAKTDKQKMKDAVKDAGDLVGASATLCVAIRELIDLQERLDGDVTTLRLTRAWEKAAREAHDDIDDRMHDLTSTGRLERPFPDPNPGSWSRKFRVSIAVHPGFRNWRNYQPRGGQRLRLQPKH